MAPQERSEIAGILEHSREEFNAAVAGIPESHASTRPEPDRWSVLECVEHVTIVEDMFLGRLQGATRADDLKIDKQREADLLIRVISRETRAVAPDPVQPLGRFKTLAEAVGQFNANRTRTIEVATERSAELYSLASQHARFGPLNGTELLVVMAGHARRHAAQIREIRASIGAPIS